MRSRIYRRAGEPELTPEELQRWTGRASFARRAKWRIEAVVYGVVEFLAGRLPLSVVSKTGAWLGSVAGALLGRRRRTVDRNLRIAFGDLMSASELSVLSREVFKRAGSNLFASLSTAKLSEKALAGAVDVRDLHIFHSALGRGKGVVMVLAHMGNWEALAQWFPRLLPPGRPGATVYRPLNNPIMNERVKAARKRLGIELFSRDDNPLGMAGFLRRGGALGVLADQRAGKLGELVPFFGRLTSSAPIPAILARRTGAALVGTSLRSLGSGRWELRFHAAEPEPEPTTAGVMKLVERMVRVSPADVFWLQERWRPERADPQRVAGKPARSGILVPTKRRRALVWFGVTAPPAPAPDDVDHEFAGAGSNARWEKIEGESVQAFIRRVDAGAVFPLDYVVGGDEPVRRACSQLGIGWTKGVDA
jgi:KDO2-lipid IV(A) lauroyltransferase